MMTLLKPHNSDEPASLPALPHRPARRRILDSARELFHRDGMNATSLGEILRHSQTGKGQFYHNFASRESLVIEVLRERRLALETVWKSQPFRSWAEVKAWAYGFLERQTRFNFERGCPDGTAAYAIQPGQDRERQELSLVFRGMCGRLRTFFEQERQAGVLSPAADPSALAALIVSVVQGSLLLGLLERSPEPGRAALAAALAHVESFKVREAAGLAGPDRRQEV